MEKLETERYQFFWNDIDIFKNFVTDIWTAADIRLVTNTNISKFPYRCFCRYNKVFC